MTTRVELRGIRQRFGRKAVLRGLNLSLRAGEVVGLMGANGAGKTTLISIIAGLLQPDEGERCYGGEAVGSVELDVRSRVAFVAHSTQLYGGLSARENLALWADLRRAAGVQSVGADEVLDRFGLGGAADRPVSTYSRGMAQRVALARALAGRPEVLLLDEPFTALDRNGRARLLEVLEEERVRGVATLIISHELDMLAAIANRIVMLEAGVIAGEVTRGPADAGRQQFRERVVGLWGGQLA